MANKPSMSHDLAAKLFNTARLLLMRENIELPGTENAKITVEYYDRDTFLDTVRTMGAGKKDFGSYYFQFVPNDSILSLQVPRERVCKKIQEEKWACEPLLTPEEFEAPHR